MNINIVQYYKDAPPAGKILIIAAGVGILVVGYIAVSQAIHSYKAKESEIKANAEITAFNSDLNSLDKSGMHPSFQASQYKQWADSIVQQFAGCDPTVALGGSGPNDPGSYSNSGKTVLAIIKQLKNNADFLALQVAFDKQTYDDCGWFTGKVGPVTLSGAVNDELTIEEIGNLNSVLKLQNITYTF